VNTWKASFKKKKKKRRKKKGRKITTSQKNQNYLHLLCQRIHLLVARASYWFNFIAKIREQISSCSGNHNVGSLIKIAPKASISAILFLELVSYPKQPLSTKWWISASFWPKITTSHAKKKEGCGPAVNHIKSSFAHKRSEQKKNTLLLDKA
jgi:hypothetical protein